MDPVADLLTRIRNAYLARLETTTAPISHVNRAILDILHKEGYVGGVEEITPDDNQRPVFKIELIYHDRTPAIERIRRISKPGRRIYTGHQQIPRPKGGIGTMIVSTPKGMMTGRVARKSRLGGEVICEVIRGAGQ